MDSQCENQDKNFECKYPYKFVSGRKILKDVEYYKKLKKLQKEYNIFNMLKKSSHRSLMAKVYNEKRKEIRQQIKELELKK